MAGIFVLFISLIIQFFAFVKDTALNAKIIETYILYLKETKKMQNSSINLAISAIIFYCRHVLRNCQLIASLERLKKKKKLPVVLNKSEIKALLNAITNLKHKTLFCLIYSSGLRVSEVIRLKYEDIDCERKIVIIKGAKGNKDRVSLLSNKAISYIRKYTQVYDIRKWLFSGRTPGTHYSVRSVQKIMEKACLKANIVKKVSVHSLRHAFATHLLESGTDIRYIWKW